MGNYKKLLMKANRTPEEQQIVDMITANRKGEKYKPEKPKAKPEPEPEPEPELEPKPEPKPKAKRGRRKRK